MAQNAPGRYHHELIMIFAALAVIALIVGVESLLYPFGRDQGIHALIAYAMSEGQIPYLDVYNIKPPLTTLFHWVALKLFGHSMLAIRVLDLLVSLATAFLIYILVQHLTNNRVWSVIAAALFSLLYYSFGFWNTAQTDGWISPFIVASILCFTLATDQKRGPGRGLKMFTAGSLLGTAVMLKYTAILFVLVMLSSYFSGKQRRQNFWPDILYGSVGGAAVAAVVLAILAAFGAINSFVETQNFVRGYVTSYWSSNVVGMLAPIAKLIWFAPVAGFFFIFGFGASIVSLVLTKSQQQRRNLSLFLMWLVIALASGLAQGKGFKYHFLPALPPIAIISAFGMTRASELFNVPWLQKVQLLPIASIFVMTFVGSWLPSSLIRTMNVLSDESAYEEYYRNRFETVDFSFSEMLAVSSYIKNRRDDEETVFVWGYEAAIYFLTERVPVCRFIYSWPLVVSFSRGRYEADLMGCLEREVPDIFVVQSGDATPHVTGHFKDSAMMLGEIETLKEFLFNCYHIEEVVGRFSVFRKISNCKNEELDKLGLGDCSVGPMPSSTTALSPTPGAQLEQLCAGANPGHLPPRRRSLTRSPVKLVPGGMTQAQDL